MYIFQTITGMWWLCVEQLSHNTRPCCRIPQLPPLPPPHLGIYAKFPVLLQRICKRRDRALPHTCITEQSLKQKSNFALKLNSLQKVRNFSTHFPERICLFVQSFEPEGRCGKNPVQDRTIFEFSLLLPVKSC